MLKDIFYGRVKNADGLPDNPPAYKGKLCADVNGEDDLLRNNSWMPTDMDSTLPIDKIRNRKKLKDTAHIIDFRVHRVCYEE